MKNLRLYEQLPTYQRQLDFEGLDHAGEIAVVGDERQVADRLQGYIDGGATEIIARVFPAGDNAAASLQRTHELLETLARSRRPARTPLRLQKLLLARGE